MIKELIESGQLAYKELELKRGDFLIREGEQENFIYLVQSGALRAIKDIGDEEVTIRFAYKGSIVTSIPAFLNGKGSEIAIHCLRKAVLWQIKKDDFKNCLLENQANYSSYLNLLNELVNQFFEREVDLLIKSPIDRLERVLKRSPRVFQEIPHKYIANYLRMSPETLSRLLKS